MAKTPNSKQTEHNLPLPEGNIYWVHAPPTAGSTTTSSPSQTTRPPLLFIHAGIADHTLWDAQSAHLTARGWDTIRYDLFGYGRSRPSFSYLNRSPLRPSIKHFDHARQVLAAYHSLRQTSPSESQCIVIGLSRGASTALDFAVAYPQAVCGLVVCNGGVGGLTEPEPLAVEAELERTYEAAIAKGDATKAAELSVRYWGEGFNRDDSSSGKTFDPTIRQRLHDWCIDIEKRTIEGTGGAAIEYDELTEPSTPAEVLAKGEVRVKTAVAVGRYDEQATRKAMEYVHEKAKGRVKYFDAAHLVNMEGGDEFNEWLSDVLDWMIDK